MAGMKQRLQKLGSVVAHGYSLPVVLSLALHGVLLVVVLTGWEQTRQKRIVPPAHVEASLVELPRAKPQPPQPPKPAVDQRRAEQQRSAEQKRQEEARQAEARRQEQQRQKELALKREKEKQEKEKQEKARREAQARKAREQQQKEAERKKQLEEDRRKKQEMLQRLEQERLEQEVMAQAQAEHDQQQVAQYSALIKSLASQYWNRPPSARNNMVAEVRINLSPFGDLLDITLVQSSGNEPFDRSVMQAIRNAAPFTEFRNLDRRIFDEYFRRITIRFRPEDLVR